MLNILLLIFHQFKVSEYEISIRLELLNNMIDIPRKNKIWMGTNMRTEMAKNQ